MISSEWSPRLTRTVGAKVIITGIRSEPARMLAQFEADLPLIKTLPRLHVALPHVMKVKADKA